MNCHPSIESQGSVSRIEVSADDLDQRLSIHFGQALGASGLQDTVASADPDTLSESGEQSQYCSIPEQSTGDADDFEYTTLATADDDTFARYADEKIRPKVWFVAKNYGLNYDDSQDVIQNTIVKIWERRSKVDRSGKIDRFVKAIARNHIVDEFRKDTAKKNYLRTLAAQSIDSEQQYDLESSQHPGELNRQGELFTIVEQILRSKGGSSRVHSEATIEGYVDLLMALSSGWSQAEYAKSRGISPGTVKSQMSAIRAKLSPYLNELHKYAAGEESQLNPQLANHRSVA